LIDNITPLLQNNKKENIKNGHLKIPEEVELHIKDVHAKYDSIISKVRLIEHKI
jgi:hypothetical protein